MDITTPQYIYLLHTREFINCKMPVYKIGRTKQANLERFLTYPKGFVILLHTICRDCSSCEKKIISLFDKKYKKRTDFGNEYYEGNYKDMKRDIFDIVEADNEIKDFCNFEENFDVIKLEQPSNDIEKIVVEQPSNDMENIVIEQPSTELTKEISKPLLQSIKTKYGCEKCGYFTNIKHHFENHNISIKHTQKTNDAFLYNCIKCSKRFITVGGLNKHKKTCKEIKNTVIKEESPSTKKEEDTYKIIMTNIKEIKSLINEIHYENKKEEG